MSAFRVMIFVALCVGLVFYLYYPDRLLLIAVCEIAAIGLLFWLTMKPVAEPDRAIVYRLATFHHVAGPGYVFVTPLIEHIEGVLDMAPHELIIEVPQIRTAEKEYVRTNLEVTWRIHPDVRGRVSSRVKATLMMEDAPRSSLRQQTGEGKHASTTHSPGPDSLGGSSGPPPATRQKLVEETVVHMARQVVGSYTVQQLSSPAAREAAAATMLDGTNEVLEPQGLVVERIFWRGSAFPGKLSEAQLEGAIRLQHADTLIKMVEAVKQRLPDMQPEEFLALQAWLDMFQRGGPGQPPPQTH